MLALAVQRASRLRWTQAHAAYAAGPMPETAVNPNLITADEWASLEPKLREHCPRLTAADLEDAGRRVDLLSAKVQNRHWVDRITARRLVLGLLGEVRKS